MIILDKMEQGSEEWLQARCSVVTASRFGEILTPTGKPTTGVKRVNYMNTLIAEHLIGHAVETYCNDVMRRGTELEPQARDMFAFTNNCDPVQVGLIYLNDKKLVSCSPDALIGSDGLWECKCPMPNTHVSYLLKGVIPSQYIPQVQGQMWVAERDHCFFHSYHPEMDSLIVRVERDDEYIKKLSGEVNKFVDEMLEKREQLNQQKDAA